MFQSQYIRERNEKLTEININHFISQVISDLLIPIVPRNNSFHGYLSSDIGVK